MSSLEHSELITLVLGVLVLGFVAFERVRILRAGRGPLPVVAFVLFVLSWAASVLEGPPEIGLLDRAQHLLALAGALVFLVWIARCVRRAGEEGRA